ncbi:MAG TPA: ABC transporter ATP-binding protein [Micromonosporaceae bacterium]|jgi:ABC-2 type transport system ATP-binding protein|nr:ABC transporter ATP-binding protein [Micromonosporaceae bacterium]
MDNHSPAISLTAVHKSFGKLAAVTDIGVTIGRGETVALLGPNGAGKTTTINMMLGLVRPDRGRAELFGATPARAIEAGRVGTVLQDTMYLPNATVRDFVELGRALYPKSSTTAEILALAGLTDRANTRLDKLSGGEAKRARFAFALAGDPDLLVLDEPTSAMDVAARQAFWAAMHRYADRGRTVVFATHYLDEADDFADRVIVIAAGRVVADGPTAVIKEQAIGRTLAFDLLGQSVDGLDRLPGVRATSVRGDRVRLDTTDADATVVALVRSGRRFANLEIASAGLEEAFLALTATDNAPSQLPTDVLTTAAASR